MWPLRSHRLRRRRRHGADLDPATGMPVTRIPVPSPALALAGVGDAHLVVGTESGMLALLLASDRFGAEAG
jgi:hypothetical protein